MDNKTNEWKNEYLKDEFVANTTLSKCTQKKDLGAVTKNLKGYAVELHESMTEILKEETESIVTLAQGLSELSVQLNKLTVPLLQFHETILSLYNLITLTETIYKQHLEQLKHIGMEQHYQLLMSSTSSIALYVEGIVQKQLEESSIDLQPYERAIDEYSININHLKESKKTGYDGIVCTSLQQKLKLLTDDKFIKGLNNRDNRTVYSCLRAYVSLNRQTDAELIYKQSVVEPALVNIFSMKNLEQHDNNLNTVYGQAIQFLTCDMSFLLDIVKRNPDLKGYYFVLNTYWKTADRLLRDNLPQTTASGNPELFQKRFRDTWNFLLVIKSRLDAKGQDHPSFQEHMKRFNLAVYFEIRHQQICASFERDLVQNVNVGSFQKQTDSEFKLKASAAFWRSINHCFHPEVFLDHLCDQFFRLSMLLQSRYLSYIKDMAEKAVKESGSEEFLINCLLDINLLKQQLGVNIKTNFKSSIYKIMSMDFYLLLEKAVLCNEKAFNATYENVVTQLININVEKGKTLLQQVGSIPRLYRRTNKSAPTEPSSYVLDIVKPILAFNSMYIDVLKDDVIKITDISINKIGEQYLAVMQEVLHSICKTEESLRRLKSRNISTAEGATPSVDLTSDEAKIREQIRLDIAYFLDNMEKLVFEPESNTLKALKKESGCNS